MYSMRRCVRAISNVSSSAARYVLTVWFQLQPSTRLMCCEITTNIEHVLPAPLLETSTFTGVSLKTLLVLTHRRILRDQRFSQPHHCFPQWVASNQSVGGRLGNSNAAPHCCKERDWANSLRLCRLVLFLVTLYSTIQSGSRHGYFCRQLQQSLFIPYGPDWV